MAGHLVALRVVPSPALRQAVTPTSMSMSYFMPATTWVSTEPGTMEMN